MYIFVNAVKTLTSDVSASSLLSSGAEAKIAGAHAHARSVYDIVLCVYERFRVDG